jgi:hypothetical protein
MVFGGQNGLSEDTLTILITEITELVEALAKVNTAKIG